MGKRRRDTPTASMACGRLLVGDLALNLREDGVGVAADKPHRADHDHEDDGQHDGVFGYVLTILLDPKLTKSLNHVSCPLGG